MTDRVVDQALRLMRPGVDTLTVMHIRHPDDVHFAADGFARCVHRARGAGLMIGHVTVGRCVL